MTDPIDVYHHFLGGDGERGLEWWVTLGFWLSLMLFFLHKARPLSAIVATMGFMTIWLPSLVGYAVLFLLLPISIWLEAIAGDGIYARIFGAKER